MMRRIIACGLLGVFLVSCQTTGNQAKLSPTEQAYLQAKAFCIPNLNGLVAEERLGPPVWVDNSDAFIYRYYPKNAKMQYMIFDPELKETKPLFDNKLLAASLGKTLNKKIDPNWLPIERVRLQPNVDHLRFTHDKKRYEFSYKDSLCREVVANEKVKEADAPSPDGYISPDKKWIVFERDNNLFLRNLLTKEEKQLTTDGTAECYYGATNVSPKDKITHDKDVLHFWPYVQWSPDSTKVATYLADFRGVPQTTFTLSCPKDGGVQKSYHSYFVYAGQEEAIKVRRLVIDISTGKLTWVKIPLQDHTNWGVPNVVHWAPDSCKYYLHLQNRGRTHLQLVEVNATTGDYRVVIDRTSRCGVPEQIGYYSFNKNLTEVFLVDERDGWAHIYRYDLVKSKLINQVTKGDWAVSNIINFDEEKKVVNFLARGREAGRDPYHKYLYQTNFDGTGLKLLTPEDADHSITYLPSGNYFIDRYSRLDMPGATVLRNAEGKFVQTLLKADDKKLREHGYIYPENFVAKGRDGKTDIYGTVFFPANFNPKKKYPVVESIYPGPHCFWAIKNYDAYFSRENALAQFGFIVVQIDGMGTFGRSRDFRNFCYKNLSDGGFPDRIAWIKALAKKYPCIDLDRVGIYGHSAGGYASMRAMLNHPDFYKVCVSSAGNHAHCLGGAAGWAEVYMGYPYGEHYKQQSNVTDAAKLQGKLLLLHGEIDDNVPVTTTLRLANALNKAGKHFKMVIAPNQYHELDENLWTRHRWNFFVRHLLGKEPLQHYKLGDKVDYKNK